MGSWVALLTALALLIGVPDLATAGNGRGTDSRVLDAIRAQMQSGEALFVAGRYQDAARAFEDGYQKHPYPAFLFNAGVAYEKLGDLAKAAERFRAYVAADPAAPDVGKVRERMARLEAQLAVRAPDGGPEPLSDAGSPDAAEAAAPQPPPAPPEAPATMKSLAVVETVPPGAPIRLYLATRDGAPEYRHGHANPAWREVAAARSPASLSLDVGRYHLVVEKFRDFNVSQIEFRVRPSYVHHLLANLSQGEFMAFLRVSANVEGAYVHLDDPRQKRAPWGKTPHGELVSGGKHTLLVDAPGFQPYLKTLELRHGEQKEIEVRLVRVAHGYLSIDANAPEAKVTVDGKAAGVWRRGEAPLSIRLDAGKHQLAVRSDGYKTLETTVNVPRGRVLPVHAQMIETYPRGAAWAQAVIGAVFLGAALYLGNESNQLHDELEADRRKGVLQEDDERITRGRWFAIGADVGFAIGGVLAILATYNFIKDPYPDSSVRTERLREFDDPKRRRPAAASARGRFARRLPERRGIEIGFGPIVGEHGGGFGIGGTF